MAGRCRPPPRPPGATELIIHDKYPGTTQHSLQVLRDFLAKHTGFVPISCTFVPAGMVFGYELYGYIDDPEYEGCTDSFYILLSGFSDGGEGFAGFCSAMEMIGRPLDKDQKQAARNGPITQYTLTQGQTLATSIRGPPPE